MFILEKENSIANHFLAELRDQSIQQDRMKFRANLERLGAVMAYEISKKMYYHATTVQTPLGAHQTQMLAEQPVLVTIMRAGLPFYQGFLHIFDRAGSAFIGAYRGTYNADHSFQIEMNYLASPTLEGKEVLLIDPMLATGKSLLKSYEALVQSHGMPKKLHVVAAIASRPGLEFLQQHLPNASFWMGAVDEELNYKSYIVPGLGDAGDLAFGEKQ